MISHSGPKGWCPWVVMGDKEQLLCVGVSFVFLLLVDTSST